VAVFRPGKPVSHRTLAASPGALPAIARVTWDTEEADGEFDPSSTLATLVIDVAGLYLTTVGWGRIAPSTSSSVRVAIAHNGVLVSRANTAATAGAQHITAAWCAQLDVDDTIETHAQTGGTGAPDLDTCFQTVVRIGPVRWT
jgi:hypothetical protein